MIKVKNGNILDATEEIICHQVNVQGIMGGGVARQLADRYKGLKPFYLLHCKKLHNNYNLLKGTVLLYGDVNNKKKIANIFSQKPNFDTDYEALKKALEYIKSWASNNNLSIAIPYGIGCGIANGDWNIVYKIIEEIFSDYNAVLYKLESVGG